jgi:site-specific DNA recombinase
MTILGADRSGPRIQCSTHRESGSCPSGSRYYVEKIEHIVIQALRLQLSDPLMLDHYVKEYRAERRRLESTARRNRSKIENSLEKTKAAIQRVVGALAAGIMTHDEVAEHMAQHRVTLARLESELASADQVTNVVELHPQAVTRFRETLEQLAKILASDAAAGGALAAHFRTLVQSVVVSPRQAGEEYEVKINGHLPSLLGHVGYGGGSGGRI